MWVPVEVTGRINLISLIRKTYIDESITLRDDAVCLRDAEILEIAARVIRDKIAGQQEQCSKCGGKGFIEYYHDAGDHFGAGRAPGSEWREKPCPKCKG